MQRAVIAWLVVTALSACGRIGFATSDGRTDSTADDSDAVNADAADRPNVAFVTSTTITGAMGGIGVADQRCNTLAMTAGIPGNFVAYLSTSTQDARDRLAGSRGWVRSDGAPVTDTIDDMINSGWLFNPIDRDENKTPVATVVGAFTGSDYNGRATANTCADWMGGSFGDIGSVAYGVPENQHNGTGVPCGSVSRLYCFEVGHRAIVRPMPSTTGRIAFVSSATPLMGIGALDTKCQTDADNANLGGTYLAAVSTTTTTIPSRFTIDSTPWRRPDGTQITATGGALFDGTALQSLLNERADGTYPVSNNDKYLLTGTTDVTMVGTSTCNDWMTTGAVWMGCSDRPTTNGAVGLWYCGSAGCAVNTYPVVCLQQ